MSEFLSSAVGVLLGTAATAVVAYVAFMLWRRSRNRNQVAGFIAAHFQPTKIDEIVIAERRFPFRVRADLQLAIDELLGSGHEIDRFCSVRQAFTHEGLKMTDCLVPSLHNPVFPVPPEYEEIDVGDEQPVRTLKNGLWMLRRGDQKFVVLLSPTIQYGRSCGVQFHVATSSGEQGRKISDEFFRSLEGAVAKAASYRGKILSLEVSEDSYSGAATGIKVHKLRTVAREQVILPRKTLDLLDRNILNFVQRRSDLKRFGQATKKGLLFYGPPGTGKTHTIHYLAGALAGHTTLLVTSEQVGLLEEYMTLARLLQPTIVVIEDADLIARDRRNMGTCEEVLLNKLLNEMDGLRAEADILFVLTTNRPEMLEPALASRPGRIDQAIEFPLPDDEGREKLVRLYSTGIEIPDDVIQVIVKRTERVSAAFIKELMRRCVQFHLERNGSGVINETDVDAALDEMLFSGGSLNLKLLGASPTVASG
jgi:hypothetical protein